MKRTKIGGSLAAVANKHGIGKVIARFPPQAMLTDEERAQALAVMRKGRAMKRDAREKEARDASGAVPGNEPAPAPVATESAACGHLGVDGVDRCFMPSGHPGAHRFRPAGDGVRSLLLSIAKDERVPPDVRLRVFEVLT